MFHLLSAKRDLPAFAYPYRFVFDFMQVVLALRKFALAPQQVQSSSVEKKESFSGAGSKLGRITLEELIEIENRMMPDLRQKLRVIANSKVRGQI